MRYLVITLLLSSVVGCGSGVAPEKKSGDPAKTDPKAATPPGSEDPKAASLKTTADLYTALTTGKAAPDQLSTDFKKIVAPPVDSDDASQGYSKERAKDFLAKWSTIKAEAPKAEAFGEVVFAAGKPGPAGRVLLRMIRDGGNWKADWLSNGPPTASEVSLSGGEDTVAILFTVAAFTDAALKKDYGLTAGLVNPSARAKIAPPASKADEAFGYSRTSFRDEVAKAFGMADRAIVAGTSRGASDVTVKVELSSGGGAKSELTLKLVKGAKPGVWLVDQFDLK